MPTPRTPTPTLMPPPPRKVRSNKGIKRRKPNVVLNNKGIEVLNMISYAPIPKEYAITIQTKVYDARQLLRWFRESKTFRVPHTNETLIWTDVLMVSYRAYGSREIFDRLHKSFGDFMRATSLRDQNFKKNHFRHLRDQEFYNYLFFQDYLNLTTDGEKVKLHPLPKGLYSKKDDINFIRQMSLKRVLFNTRAAR